MNSRWTVSTLSLSYGHSSKMVAKVTCQRLNGQAQSGKEINSRNHAQPGVLLRALTLRWKWHESNSDNYISCSVWCWTFMCILCYLLFVCGSLCLCNDNRAMAMRKS
eukprot:Lankesteria_metandrocarpae@DN5271_c2_g1_i7.p2